jgi:hypothetical protein
MEGWITITPLRPQLTAEDLMEGARAVLDGRSQPTGRADSGGRTV